MKVLLDTNIIIHREAGTIVDPDIGILFKWIDDLHYQKCIHAVTVEDIKKHKDKKTVAAFTIKLQNYHLLQTKAPLSQAVQEVSSKFDKEKNDFDDTLLLNEIFNGRVDFLISEDKGIHFKAGLLEITDRVFTIDSFLEKVTTENPGLVDYKVLSVQQNLFGNLNRDNHFFDVLKEDYPGFEKWFNKKAEERAYVCQQADKLLAFLYLKIEGESEDYSDITPCFSKKKRLKIGTLKVDYNGFRLGERFLKIVFDNALRFKVDEIYVTIFDKRLEQQRLIRLLEAYGFIWHGYKKTAGVQELVYVRDFSPRADRENPRLTFPFVSASGSIFIVPIHPEYHTNLFPDSILRTESPEDFIDNEPFRNAISKVYISRAIERNLHSGDIIIFYRTGGYYQSVVTTFGIIEQIIDNLPNVTEFIRLCKRRSVFSDAELAEQWNYKPRWRPFIVNFLYAYSFPHRINFKRLIELHVFKGWHDCPRGFYRITRENLEYIVKECQIDKSIIID